MYRLACLLLYGLAFGLVVYIHLIAPDPVALILIYLITVATPAMLLVGVKCEGNGRLFCIRALFPIGTMLFAFSYVLAIWVLNAGLDLNDSMFSNWWQLRVTTQISVLAMRVLSGITWLASIIVGLLAVGFAWLLNANFKPGRNANAPRGNQD